MTESGYNQILVIIDHFKNTLDITVWLSDDISVGQRKSLRGGPDERVDEEVTHCSSALNDLPSPDQRVSGETKWNVGEHAKGILLKIHDRLG